MAKPRMRKRPGLKGSGQHDAGEKPDKPSQAALNRASEAQAPLGEQEIESRPLPWWAR